MAVVSGSRSICGLSALITGAASGMGEATARLFADEGAIVAITDVDRGAAERLANEITAQGNKAKAWHLDVSDREGVEAAVGYIGRELGGIDILVNNAGLSVFCDIDSPDYPDLWDRMIAINLTGPQQVIRAALPWLRQSKYPRIVNIASTEAWGATIHDSAYVASKTGLVGLTRALALDLGKDGILVNAICPGAIDTPMTAFVSARDKDIFAKRRTMLRRYGLPGEVAQMTLNLCLPATSYVTGAIIPVDGGLVARNA